MLMYNFLHFQMVYNPNISYLNKSYNHFKLIPIYLNYYFQYPVFYISFSFFLSSLLEIIFNSENFIFFNKNHLFRTYIHFLF